MNRPTRPTYCARCKGGGLANWNVSAPGRGEVVCNKHLDAAKAWAGPRAIVVAVVQPGDVVAEMVVQDGLFDMPGGR
jgi:hypothetical protein